MSDITNTAFFKYLQSLDEKERAEHLLVCAMNGDENNMFWELAEAFKEYDPRKLAKLLGEL